MAFTETQKINQLLFKLIYIVSTAATLSVVVGTSIVSGKTTDLFLILGLVVFLVIIYFLVFDSKAETRIDTVGISYRYWPLIREWKTIPWQNIEKLEIKKINPLSDYGGWGYRFGQRSKGIILSKEALIITRKNAKSFTISTKKVQQMRDEIKHKHAELLK